jgi:hypothetical protein
MDEVVDQLLSIQRALWVLQRCPHVCRTGDRSTGGFIAWRQGEEVMRIKLWLMAVAACVRASNATLRNVPPPALAGAG